MGMDLKKAIDQISKDRGIDRDLLVDTLEEAVRSSVIRKYGEDIDVEVGYADETGEIEAHQFKIVTENVEDATNEIALDEARQYDPNVNIDDEIGFKLKIEDLGRIAAQSAKQVIIQRMRDAEQEIIYEEFKDRVGDIISGIIQRRDRAGWIINLGRTEALLPKEEQIPREHYKRGDRVQAFLIDVRKEGRGPQVIVSRSHPDYMNVLFKREVPEVDDSTVTLMGVARDPGSRAKVAVVSRDRDVDPVGACVGIRGSRIQNVVQELRGERIDIVVWSPDIATYAKNALSPAIITRITVDDDEKQLEVVVPDDQLTLAIGRKGQNVKLASKLLGWKIDIYTETRFNELNVGRQAMEQLASVAEVNVDIFLAADLDCPEAVAMSTDEELAAIEGLTESKIADIRSALNILLPAPALAGLGDYDDEEDEDADQETGENADEQISAEQPEDGAAEEEASEAEEAAAPETPTEEAPVEAADAEQAEADNTDDEDRAE